MDKENQNQTYQEVPIEQWKKEQNYINTLLSDQDNFTWDLNTKSPNCLKYIGGVDISFSKRYDNIAVAILVVLEYPSLKKVYENYEIVKLEYPYVPSYLAFREAAHLAKLYNQIKEQKPEYTPQVIMVDGNGIWHQNGCGLASHLGVLIDVPTIGIAKTVYFVDGLSESLILMLFDKYCINNKQYYKVKGKNTGKVWGAIMRVDIGEDYPIIISTGHKISLNTACQLVKYCCVRDKIPEPVSIADYVSRKIVKQIRYQDTQNAVINKLKYFTDNS